MTELVFCGVATEDVIAVVERMPGADERVLAEQMVFAGGGPAATAAVTAVRLGVPARLIAAVGDDEAGDQVVAGLRAEGVDTSGILRVPGASTAQSIVVVSGPQRSRAIVNRPGPAIDPDPDEWARLLDGARWLHVDQHGWPTVAERDLSADVRLSVDAGNPIPGLRLDRVDLYVPTVEALRSNAGEAVPANGSSAIASPEELVSAAVAAGADRCVATGGAAGSWATDGDRVIHVDPPSTEVTSTLGAGDVFHGALLAGLVHHDHGRLPGDLSTVLGYATATATLSCRALDGRTAIPTHDEVLDLLEIPTSPGGRP